MVNIGQHFGCGQKQDFPGCIRMKSCQWSVIHLCISRVFQMLDQNILSWVMMELELENNVGRVTVCTWFLYETDYGGSKTDKRWSWRQMLQG